MFILNQTRNDDSTRQVYLVTTVQIIQFFNSQKENILLNGFCWNSIYGLNDRVKGIRRLRFLVFYGRWI